MGDADADAPASIGAPVSVAGTSSFQDVDMV